MRTVQRPAAFALSALAAALIMPATPIHSQTPVSAASAAPPAVVDALLRDIAQLEEKLLGLADAIPERSYGWRPGEGVRSVSEVMIHVAADNWFLPTIAGVAAPEATGIKGGDYPSVQAYEARSMSKAEALQALRDSFAHLRAAMEATDDAFLARTLNIFGMEMTGLDLWVMTATHLHEHLGQSIAYARSNGIVPPWSR
ncbi:MAG: DinB family protein [Longimicrobiales bacterium]